jgi:hypothetical protein
MTKKFIVVLAMLVGLVSGASAENYKGQLFYVKGFYPSTKKVKDNLLQKNTKYSNACGLTSLLFVNNYISYNGNGIIPSFLESKSGAISALDTLYDYLDKGYNTVTTLDNIKKIEKNRWGWKNTRRRLAA